MHGLSQCKPCASAAHVEPSIPFSRCSPSCFGSHACGFQLVRLSFEKAFCLATNRAQSCMQSRRVTETVLMRLTISFKMGCSLHVSNCWGTRLLPPAEESLYFSMQTKVQWKVQNFLQKFWRHFWTTGTCLTLSETLGTSTPARCRVLEKALVKTDPLQVAISREAHFSWKSLAQY